MAQQVPKKAEFDKLNDALNNCLQHTQKIRDIVSTSQPFKEVSGDRIKSQFVIKQLEDQINSLNAYYDSIEKAARELPDSTKMEIENNISLTSFHQFVKDSFGRGDGKNDKFFNAAIEGANYMEYMTNYGKYVGEFLPSIGQKFKSIYETEIDLPNTDYEIDNIQKRFEKIFIECIREANRKAAQQKAYKFSEKFLERGTLRAIIDIQLLSKSDTRALLLVNNGQVDFVNIYANNEGFKYFDGKMKMVDVYAPSKSEMYKNLTQLINNQLQIFYQGQMKRHDDKNTSMSFVINYIITLLLKTNQAVASKCKICDKYLRNDLPPLHIDFRHKAFIHPECR
uniref:Uncharacterized protein n=1 Tax=Panagrolaimus davidi TaxID=227884 RepID=A0A914QHB7_9BILA